MPITKYVDGTNGNDSNGGGVDDPYATIRKAVATISSGDSVSDRNTIIIHSGTYVEGPIRGGDKNNIKFTTAGDGNVHIKHGDFESTDAHRVLEVGTGWNIEGNGLDLVFFAHGGLGIEEHTDEFLLIAVCTTSGSGGASLAQSTLATSATAMTASSCVFLGTKYTYYGRSPNELTADQDGFGTAFSASPDGPAKNCVFLHLSRIGGSRGNGKLDFNGNLVYMTGLTESFNANGVYVPNASSDFCNNTFAHCSGGAQFTRFPGNKMLNNFFLNCISYGHNASSANNWFLDKDFTTTKGNLVRAMTLSTLNAATTLWESDSQPANQMSGTATNMVELGGATYFVGFNARQILTNPNKGYKEGGAFSNVKDAFIFHCSDAIFPKDLSILPFGGKSANHTAEKSSLVDAEGITGRSIATVDLTTDLLGNAYLNRATPSVGCFAGNYVEYAFEPEVGREKTVEHVSSGRQTAITVNDVDEDRKSSFRNVDGTTFNRPSITAAGLRGRHTTYRVTTTKT